MSQQLDSALHAWKSLLGDSEVLDSRACQERYGQDTGGSHREISAALRISEAQKLPAVMRIAQQFGISVYPISTGKNWGYGSSLPVQNNCVILDLAGMRRIIEFDAELGVVTLEPGVTQAMLADFLDAGHHNFMVPVTGAGPHCSLLANALERGYGATPHTDHFGAVTELSAVLADGTTFQSALSEAAGEKLARLHKWGVGPYATGLFTQGNFGIVTSMSIALARRPECVKACLFSLKHEDQLEEAALRIRRIIGSLPGTVGAFNLMNQRRVLSMAAPFPIQQIGPSELIPQALLEKLGRKHQILPWTGFGTLYGSKRMVSAAQQEITAILSGLVGRLMFVSQTRANRLNRIATWIPGQLGKDLQGMTATLAKSLELVSGRPNETALPLAYWRNQISPRDNSRNPAKDGCGLLWYAPLVPLRPSDVRAYVDMVTEVTMRHNIEPLITFTTLSERLFDSTVPIVFDRANASAVESAHVCYRDLVETGRKQGWFPYRFGIDSMEMLRKLSPQAQAFQSRLKHSLDPDRIISPGRYD